MKIIKIIKACIKQSIIYDFQYRTHLVINSLVSFGWTFLSFLTVDIVGERSEIINSGWEKHEYRLFWGITFISVHVVWFFFKTSIQEIPDKIVRGNLDSTLVKPYNSKILASLGRIRIEIIPTTFFTLYVVIRALSKLSNSLPLSVDILITLIITSIASIIFYSIFISMVSLSFWLIGADNLSFLFTRIMGFSFYPLEAFSDFIRILFTTLIPLAFFSTIPAEIIINFSLDKFILLLLAALITSKISDIIWNLGLKSYQSASS